MADCDYFSNTGVTCDATAFHPPCIFTNVSVHTYCPLRSCVFVCALMGSLSNNHCRVSEKAHFQIINIEFGERSVVRFVGFHVLLFVDDCPVEPDNGEVVRLDPLWK